MHFSHSFAGSLTGKGFLTTGLHCLTDSQALDTRLAKGLQPKHAPLPHIKIAFVTNSSGLAQARPKYTVFSAILCSPLGQLSCERKK